MSWSEFWERSPISEPFFRAVAADYCRRLAHAVPFGLNAVCLDFGCGPGYVGALLAPRVQRIDLYDGSSRMRDLAGLHTSALPNAAVLADARDCEARCYDVILVNSVLQYFSAAELADWLGRWRGWLGPEGVLVVSDVPAERPAFAAELLASLRFALRRRCLVSYVRQAVAMYRARYARAVVESGLACYPKGQLVAEMKRRGLEARLLHSNLTYNRYRYAAAATRAGCG